MLVEAYRHPEMNSVLKSADMVTPDGMPLVWMMRNLGAPTQDRVAGLDILAGVCQAASDQGVGIFFVGSTPEILNRMRTRLNQEFPNLPIAGMEPLPFRPLTPDEDQALMDTVHNSGAGLVMVSLGLP